MLLEAKDVSKVFRGRRSEEPVRAVDSASIRARPGEFVAIVGESCSGKSTLARILLDLIPASAGNVELDGELASKEDAAKASEAAKQDEGNKADASADTSGTTTTAKKAAAPKSS